MAQFQLMMHSGPTPGKTFPLEGDVLTIGREAGNAIAINDAEVSRKHAQLVLQGGKYVITDLGSTNGTFVNGQRLTGQHVLQSGEVISLGEQISLLYEAVVKADPNATVISSPMRAPVPPAAQPTAYIAPEPVAPAPQSPGYAGQIPSSPPPEQAYIPPPPPPAKKKGLPLPAIIAGVVLLCLICSCISFFWWIDNMNAWCDWFPFLFGGACG
jgi:pSer/pThr/pTyr-binding forkhead associated (FHA) protein